MNRIQFLNYINKKATKGISQTKGWAIKKVLEKILEIISKVLVIPPIIFTGVMILGMLILTSTSWFSINMLPDFVYMLDTKLIIGMLGVIISMIFACISIIGWPLYILVLISGIWFIKTYRKFIKNNYLYIKANDLMENL